MIELLESLGCTVIPCAFDRVYAFGGSFHCCTADIRREGTLQSYFPSLDGSSGTGNQPSSPKGASDLLFRERP